MKVSVIFTTYNHPKWLEKVLWGFFIQTYPDFEIMVADDGSGEETRQVIEKVSEQMKMPVKHIWHEDNGFRKCEILNKAITFSKGEYLIFTDGDCIPHPNFVKHHVDLSEKGKFLSGGYIKLPLGLSRKISREDILSGNATNPWWLLAHHAGRTPKIMKLARNKKLGAIFDFITPTRATWNGHSSSTWKEYAVRTNGFDERMQYGGQDREFGERLMNMGIKGKQVRYRCSCVHLDHERGYAREEIRVKNHNIRNETKRCHITKTRFGIVKNI